MQIVNTKTGVIYYTSTTQDRNGFASCVIRRDGSAARLVSREIYPTRARAYRAAVKVCEALAANHAFIN